MKELICIVCPNGCELQVDDEGEEIKVTGATCRRGIEFAKQEILNPKRILCTTVKTIFPDYPVISVRTSKEIDKNKIFMVMNEINKYILNRRVICGDIIIANILNTSVDIISTSSMD